MDQVAEQQIVTESSPETQTEEIIPANNEATTPEIVEEETKSSPVDVVADEKNAEIVEAQEQKGDEEEKAQVEAEEDEKVVTTNEGDSTNWARQVSNEEEQKQKEADEQAKAGQEKQQPQATDKSGKVKKARKKKEVDPAAIPRKGYFFEHDNREDDEEDPVEAEKKEVPAKIEILGEVQPKNEEETREKSELREEADKNEDLKSEEVVKSEEITKNETAEKPAANKSVRPKISGQIQKFGANKGGKSNFRRKMLSENSESACDEEARWSHDKFDLTEQQPKSKTELVKRYGFDIREEEEKAALAQEEVERQQEKANKDKKNGTKYEGDARRKLDALKAKQQESVDSSAKRPQQQPQSQPGRSYPHQKDRIISNSSRRVVASKSFNASGNKEWRNTSDQQMTRSSSSTNQNENDFRSYQDNSATEQYYDEEDEENDENERLNVLRRNGDNEGETFIGNFVNLRGLFVYLAQKCLSPIFIPNFLGVNVCSQINKVILQA